MLLLSFSLMAGAGRIASFGGRSVTGLIFFFGLCALFTLLVFFFFNDPAPPEIYPFSLHAALPISHRHEVFLADDPRPGDGADRRLVDGDGPAAGRRRPDDARVEHAGDRDLGDVLQGAVHLVGDD